MKLEPGYRTDGCCCSECGTEFHVGETDSYINGLRAKIDNLRADVDRLREELAEYEIESIYTYRENRGER